jgi:hypothetical protein
MNTTYAGHEADWVDGPEPPQTQTARSAGRDDSPSAWHLVFASLFTPTWSLSLLLFVCLFLPSYEGCSGETIYIADAVSTGLSADVAFYPAFLVIWPYLFGLIVAIGTVCLARSRQHDGARRLWWWLAGLFALHAVVLAAALAREPPSSWSEWQSWEWGDILSGLYWLGTTVFLIVLIPITGVYCRTWFNAAMWLQLAGVVTAAIYLSYFMPVIAFAHKLLLGGRLAVACSVLLIVSTIVERMDGHRALVRRRGEPPLRLSLKSTLLLMVLGGLACAWAGAYLVFDLEFWEKE